jgi:hypothetical protein
MKPPTIPNPPATPSERTTLTPLASALIKRAAPQPSALHDPRDWLALKEAAHFLHVSRRTVLRMTDTINRKTGRPYLRMWRPTPGTIMICKRSLEEFCRLTQEDPEFWEKRARERRSFSVSALIKPIRRPRCPRPPKAHDD